MRPLFPAEIRRRLQENTTKWYIKAILQALCTFLAFLALILFADATALTNKYSPSPHGDWSDWMPLFPVLISLIFNPLSLTFLFLNKPLHPGWEVSAHLLTWVLGIPSIVFGVGYGWFWWWQPTMLEFDHFIPCNNEWNFWTKACNPVIYTAGKIEIAANVFLGLLIVFTFTLFVLACVATHKRRRAAYQSKIASRNIQLQYHRNPEEHAAQEPPAYTPRSDEEQAMPSPTKYS